MCRLTMGHLRVIVGHPRVTIGHPRVTIGHLRATLGHLGLTKGYLKASVVHIRVTIGHLRQSRLKLLRVCKQNPIFACLPIHDMSLIFTAAALLSASGASSASNINLL